MKKRIPLTFVPLILPALMALISLPAAATHDSGITTTVLPLHVAGSIAGMSADGNRVLIRKPHTNVGIEFQVYDIENDAFSTVNVNEEGQFRLIGIFDRAHMDANGTVVALTTKTALFDVDTDKDWDIYVRDLKEDTITLLTPGECKGQYPLVSGDGDWVLYESWGGCGSSLDPAEDGTLRSLRTGSTWSVPAVPRDLSSDGRFALVRRNAGAFGLWDRDSGDVEWIPEFTLPFGSYPVAPEDRGWTAGAISDDGRYVLFSDPHVVAPNEESEKSVVAHDADVVLYDRETGRYRVVSVNSHGTDDRVDVRDAELSPDGEVAIHYNGYAQQGYSLSLYDVFGGVGWRFGSEVIPAELRNEGFLIAGGEIPTISADHGRIGVSLKARYPDRYRVLMIDVGAFPVGIKAVHTSTGADTVAVEGAGRFTSAMAAHSDDPRDDGEVVAGLSAEEVGAEISGVDIVSRPEGSWSGASPSVPTLRNPYASDVLFRVMLTHLPDPVATLPPGVPGITYKAGFRLGEDEYELRASALGATPAAEAVRCSLQVRTPEEPAPRIDRIPCTIGTTGDEVLMFLPAEMLGPQSPRVLRDVRIAADASGPAEASVELDSVTVGEVRIPEPEVTLAVAPETTPLKDVQFDEATIQPTWAQSRQSYSFSGDVSLTGLTPGNYFLWTRACLGERCRFLRDRVDVPGFSPAVGADGADREDRR